MGPMVAGRRFLDEIKSGDWPRPAGAEVARVSVSLHGSLAFTGVGHATDRAVILGLQGFLPDTIDPDEIEPALKAISDSKAIRPAGHPSYRFDPETDLVFDRKQPLPGHANGMQFRAFDAEDRLLLRRVYYSIGGGFVVSEEEFQGRRSGAAKTSVPVPYPFATARQMLDMAAASNLSIAEMKRANELVSHSEDELDSGIERIWQAMKACVARGLSQDGELPGGLRVQRRARKLFLKMEEDWSNNRPNPLAANDWLSVYAMAVNEENAAGGRVVTAPTNGAAGVIPAVLHYWMRFYPEADESQISDFFLTAAAVGGLIKHNASISGAEVGCQGEVGSASAMAAAGLAALMGGTPMQVENAAEIALEHHLGMTCDPVAGLVQVPCIERNALGAVKAVTAASLALKGDGKHFVSLDAAVETMRQTGRDMDERYKETSLGGLAVNVIEC